MVVHSKSGDQPQISVGGHFLKEWMEGGNSLWHYYKVRKARGKEGGDLGSCEKVKSPKSH